MDYLRGIAIILVVYRHVLIGIRRSHIAIPQPIATANLMFYSFRMPLFFILSGIFISKTLKKKSLGSVVYIKFENLLYPYLIWSFLQVSFQILFSSFTNASRSLIDYTYIFYQPQALDQFWYLPALFNTTLIYILLKVRLKLPNWIQLLLGLLFYLTAHYFERITLISDWMQFYIFFAIGDALSGTFFKKETQTVLQHWLTLILTIPVFVISQIYYLGHLNSRGLMFLPISLTGCFMMLLIAFRFQRWNILPILRVFGFHSLFIYAMHVLVSAFVRLVLTKAFGIHDPVILLICGITAGITIPVIIYNLLIVDNIGWWLFSPKKPARFSSQSRPVISAAAPEKQPVPREKPNA